MSNKNAEIQNQFESQFIIKTPGNEEDVKKLAVFNDMIHEDESIYALTRELINHHPVSKREYWPYLEEKKSGQIICSLCLIPWTFHYDEVTIKSAEMGIVGTHPDYRGRGLMSYLISYYEKLLKRDNFVISHIQGIPFFYSKYDYIYSLPLENDTRLELHQIPDWTGEEKSSFSIITCGAAEGPLLQELYKDHTGFLDIYAHRDLSVWDYLAGPSMKTETKADTYAVFYNQSGDGGGDSAGDNETNSKKAEGYFRIAFNGFGDGLIVTEAHALTARAALVMVKKMREIAVAMKKPCIRFNMSRDVPFMKTVSMLGSKNYKEYAWQIRLADIPGFLERISPVLEKRINSGLYAGCTREAVINLYTTCIKICIEKGKITGCYAEKSKTFDNYQINISYEAFVKLVLGYKSRQELERWYHDLFITDGESAAFLDELFPKMKGYLYTIY